MAIGAIALDIPLAHHCKKYGLQDSVYINYINLDIHWCSQHSVIAVGRGCVTWRCEIEYRWCIVFRGLQCMSHRWKQDLETVTPWALHIIEKQSGSLALSCQRELYGIFSSLDITGPEHICNGKLMWLNWAKSNHFIHVFQQHVIMLW